ncbi:hypothetical protein C8R44DRAFT_888127 [Mycena epipterygia]|nr:hypothetical protein C8R44DRAFT_888127 [Mycena epipterygia]
MDDYMSGRSSPANSIYGDSMMSMGSSGAGEYPRLHIGGGPTDSWTPRSSSPANASAYMLGSSHRSSSTSFSHSIDIRLQKLDQENLVLRAENNALKSAYHELANAVPALLRLTSNPFDLQVPDDTSNIPQFGRTPLPPLAEGDYPDVPNWHKPSAKKGAGVSNDGGSNPRGRTLVSKGVNVSGKYIVDEKGDAVDGFRLSAMGRFAARIWFFLLAHQRAPFTWGEAPIDVVALYTTEMERQFPELRLCADSWKAQRIATLNYPSWIGTRRSEEDAPTKSQKKGKRASVVTPAPPNEPRKKIKLDDTTLMAFNPLWEPLPTSETPDPFAAAPELLHAIPVPITLGDAGPSEASSGVPVAAATAEAIIVSLPAVSVEVLTASPMGGAAASPLTISETVGPTVLPPSAGAAAEAEAEAATRNALIQTAFPPRIPAAPPLPSATSSTSAPPGAVKVTKAAKMVPTSSLTARNLCSRDWVDKHHGTRAAFVLYWESLTKDELQHWNTISATAKANAATNTAVATA